uniref:Death domain-containing protein n=2 Tax=Amphimedon queenslandica TaxID=400682 RepID=A0A1X7TX61_AMPQE
MTEYEMCPNIKEEDYIQDSHNSGLRFSFSFDFESVTLYKYCSNGEPDKVIKLIHERTNLNLNWKHTGKFYRTPLVIASHKGHTEIVKILLQNDALRTPRDSYGWNALDYACHHGHEDVVYLLISDPNWVKNGKTFFFNESSLHIACRSKRVRIAIALLKNGAETIINDKTSKRNTALHFAVRAKSYELVEALLKKQASITIKNMDNKTPFEMAKDMHFLEAVQLIKESIVARPLREHDTENDDDSVNGQMKVPRNVKFLVSGPPQVGKSVFTKRFKGEIINLKKTKKLADSAEFTPPNNPDDTTDEPKSNRMSFVFDTGMGTHMKDIIDIDVQQYEMYNVLPHLFQGQTFHLVVFDISVDLTKELSIIRDDGSKMCYVPVQFLHQLLSHYNDVRSYNSRAVLLATNVDRIDDSCRSSVFRQKDKEIRKYFGKASFLSNGFLVFDDDTGLIFLAVDNMNGNEEEMSQISSFINKELQKSSSEVEVSISCSSFFYKLRDHGGLIQFKEWIEMAKIDGISQKEIPQILNFASQEVGLFLYFEEVEGFKDFVIIDLSSFIRTITSALLAISSKNKDISNTGIISKHDLDQVLSLNSHLPIEMAFIINLLKYYNILLDFDPKQYFIPSLLLPDTRIASITEDEIKTKNPILFQFEDASNPITVLSALVTELSKEKALLESIRFNNHIKFHHRNTSIRAMIRFSYLEIQVDGGSGDPSNVYEFMKKVIFNSHDKAPPFFTGFYCSSVHPRPHFSKLESPGYTSMVCTEFRECPNHQKAIALSSHHKEWLVSYTPMAKKTSLSLELLNSLEKENNRMKSEKTQLLEKFELAQKDNDILLDKLREKDFYIAMLQDRVKEKDHHIKKLLLNKEVDMGHIGIMTPKPDMIHKIAEALKPMEDDWYMLGEFLVVGESQLYEIDQNKNGSDSKLECLLYNYADRCHELLNQVEKFLKKMERDDLLTELYKSVCDNGILHDYLVPLQDKLDDVGYLVPSKCQKGKEPSYERLGCLIAGKEIFLIQGGNAHQMNWKEYGLSISISEGSLSSTETAMISVVALAGGPFIFPENTVLVSAVYAISVSKKLLKPFKLELQHCVRLEDESQAKFLKFVTAPISSAKLPLQFTAVEGGEFPIGSSYGSIKRGKYCLMGITGEKSTIAADDQSEGDKSNKQLTRVPTPIVKAMGYTLMIYYEPKYREYWVTFTAVKNLDALHKYIEAEHATAEKGPHEPFSFKEQHTEIQLKLEPTIKTDRWTIQTHSASCKMRQTDMDMFGEGNHSLPPECIISVYSSSNAYTDDSDSALHYPVPVEGTTEPMTLFIHRQVVTSPNSPANQFSPADDDKAKDIFQEQIDELTVLLSKTDNRLIIASKLFSKKLISEAGYNAATDENNKSGLQNGTTLLMYIREAVNQSGKSAARLRNLIDIFSKEDAFKPIAEEMSKKLK